MKNQTAEAAFEKKLEEATDWLLALQEKPAAETRERFEAWLSESPQNKRAYEEISAAWRASAHAAAAPEAAAARTAARKTGAARRATRFTQSWRTAAALAVTAVLGGGAVLGYDAYLKPVDVHATSVGERKEIRLADGSVVHLNTATRIGVRYSLFKRRIELERGQVYAKAAPNPRKPFVVAAGGVSAKALGTEFDVYRAAAFTRVAVHEGRVRVLSAAPNSAKTDLDVGEFVNVAPIADALTAQSLKTIGPPSWLEGRIEFDDVTLEEAVAEFNRYSSSQIRIADAAIGGFRISGAFDTSERDAFLTTVQALTNADIRRVGPNSVWLYNSDYKEQ